MCDAPPARAARARRSRPRPRPATTEGSFRRCRPSPPGARYGRYGARVPPAESVDLEIAGRTVRITSPGKVFFPERGETKLDLVRYYEAVREPLMAVMGGRPLPLQPV